MNTIIIILIIIFIIYLISHYQNYFNKECFNGLIDTNNSYKYIWVYWENINRSTYPSFIKLCFDIMKKNLGNTYNLIILNEKTINNYLPNLHNNLNYLHIAQKADYYRIALLYKYGGIWIDADVIILKDLKPIFDKIDEGYDYVGFGCTGYECNNGYGFPSNWVMASKQYGILMKTCLDKLNNKLNKINKNNINSKDITIIDDDTYHDYGKLIIWEAIQELRDYKYFHFTSEYDGNRDINSKWIHTPNFFNTEPTTFLDSSKVMFVVLYNSEFSKDPNLKWIYDCSDHQLIYSPYWISTLFKLALQIN